MIDFHNHILPKIDDGSKSLEMSLNMLREAERQGITDVVNTVHFQHPKMNGREVTYDIIKKEIEIFQKVLDVEDINIKVHIGSEVFFLPNLMEIKENPLCTMGGGKYMLIEFYPFHLPPNFDKHFYQLKLSGTTPIIAHPERNTMIQKDINILKKLIDSGCLVQVDAASLIGDFGPECKKISELLLQRNMVHFLGSDAHNDKKRNFCLLSALDIARSLMGDDADILIMDNPSKLISGQEIIPFPIKESLKKKFSFWDLFNTKNKIK